MHLVAIDWYSRRVLAWRVSNTMDSAFCVEALEEAERVNLFPTLTVIFPT